MSDTPQTDSVLIEVVVGSFPDGSTATECVVDSQFARKLERQRNDLLEALEGLLTEYEDRKSQWGDEYLWGKHENKEVIESARVALAKAKGEKP